MRQLFQSIIAVLVLTMTFTACSDSLDKADNLSVSTDTLSVGPEGCTKIINVRSNSPWVAVVSHPWLSVSPANGVGDTDCEIRIDPALTAEMRNATIAFTIPDQEPVVVQVFQSGFDGGIMADKTDITLEPRGAYGDRYFKVCVTASVDYAVRVAIADDTAPLWLTTAVNEVRLEEDENRRTTDLRFDWEINPNFEERKATIYLEPLDTSDETIQPVVISVTQKPAQKIEDNRAGDSLAILFINESLCSMNYIDPSENMRNWSNVELWEQTDKDLPCPEAVGRVRGVSFSLFDTKETLPQEVRYLRYAETISFYGNTNTMYRTIHLASDICQLEYLKHLRIGAYGLVSLPDDFVKLGRTLETLNIGGNNFEDIPDCLTPENFPHLTTLEMNGMRRWDAITDLSGNLSRYTGGIGMNLNITNHEKIRRLFLWEKLEVLSLSYGYLEGTLPDFTVGEEGVRAYTQEDVDAFGGDTIQWAADHKLPRILPNARRVSVNLNFLTGPMPDWLLYHPLLMEFDPEILIFNQMESSKNSQGIRVGFSNTPTNFEYYYEAYPKYRAKYQFNDVSED